MTTEEKHRWAERFFRRLRNGTQNVDYREAQRTGSARHQFIISSPKRPTSMEAEFMLVAAGNTLKHMENL